MRLNQLKPGLQYKLISQTGPVHVPVFTMAVEVDGKNFEASGPSKRTAKLHVAVKVRNIDMEDQLFDFDFFSFFFFHKSSKIKIDPI